MKSLFIILLFPLCAKAQVNPGFMGIRDVVTVSAQVHPLLFLSNYKLAPSFSFSYEHSFSRGFALELSYAGYKSNMNAADMELLTGNYYITLDDNSQYKNIYFKGNAVIKHNTFMLHLKDYLSRLGAIAPVGTYVSLDLGTNNWSIKKQDYYGEELDGTKYNDPDKPVVSKMIIAGFSIGTRRMLSEHLGLVMRSAFSYPISSNLPSTITYAYSTNMHEVVNENEAYATKFRGILQFEMGFSYNL